MEIFCKRSRRIIIRDGNKDRQYLRALFNFGITQELVKTNPTQGLEFMPVEEKMKRISSKEDVAKVILAAEPATQDGFPAEILTQSLTQVKEKVRPKDLTP